VLDTDGMGLTPSLASPVGAPAALPPATPQTAWFPCPQDSEVPSLEAVGLRDARTGRMPPALW
jgi:hypothetical protein